MKLIHWTLVLSFISPFFFLNSCSTSSLSVEYQRFIHQRDSISAEINALNRELEYTELELFKTLYETEFLRNSIVKAEADSVVYFYHNYLFNFRRPIVAQVEPDRNSPFLFPVSFEKQERAWLWKVLWGRLFYFDYNHLGIDLYAFEGDTVRAIYDGVIRYYGPANGYGELIAVVEHAYTHPWKERIIPPQFISLYGHIRSRCHRDSTAVLPWKEGDRIRRGEVIGFINDDDHNGAGGEHLHFGIRMQTAESAKANDGGLWMRGYDNRKGEHFRYFLNPVELYGRYIRFVFDPEDKE